MSRHTKKKIVRSGDPLANWFFRQFMNVLASERVRISRKRRLVDPDDPHRQVIRGLMDPKIHPSGNWIQILINPSKNTHTCRDEEVETLIHELSHVVAPKASERAILRMEAMLAKRLTMSQLRELKAFLPRHEVKRYPTLRIPGRVATA